MNSHNGEYCPDISMLIAKKSFFFQLLKMYGTPRSNGSSFFNFIFNFLKFIVNLKGKCRTILFDWNCEKGHLPNPRVMRYTDPRFQAKLFSRFSPLWEQGEASSSLLSKGGSILASLEVGGDGRLGGALETNQPIHRGRNWHYSRWRSPSGWAKEGWE